jgi:hypothetical protein
MERSDLIDALLTLIGHLPQPPKFKFGGVVTRVLEVQTQSSLSEWTTFSRVLSAIILPFFG